MYLILKRNYKHKRSNQHYKNCMEENIPCIFITRNGLFKCTLDYDFYTVNPVNPETIKKVFEVVSKIAKRKDIYSGFTGRLTGLDLKTSEYLAQSIYDIFLKYNQGAGTCQI